MVDKQALLALPVQERLTAIHQMSKEDVLSLIDNVDGSHDDKLIDQLCNEIAANKEFVRKLTEESRNV